MKIKGLFCGTTAATNEEYREVLKRRNLWMAALAIAGLLIAGLAFFAEGSEKAVLPEYILGVYCGFGIGLALAGLALIVRNLLLLKDENKLKQNRLENTDERLTEIGNRASMTAIKVTLLIGTVSSLIAGIYEPVLVKAFIIILEVFLLSYIAAFSFFKKRM